MVWWGGKQYLGGEGCGELEINKIIKNIKRGIRTGKGEREVQKGKGLGELSKNRVMWYQDSFTTNRVRE